MGVGKRFLASRLARHLAGWGMRLYRWAFFAGVRWRHDPRLRRLLATRQPAIFVCWHQDFLYTMGYLSRWTTRRPTFVLASASRDGGLAAAAAEGVGFLEPVRGSSARGGVRALRGLGRLPAHASIAIVGDGPRPPARRLAAGALHLARASGRPIWLVRTTARPRLVLRGTWARFFVLPPWGRGATAADGPHAVPADLDRAGLERLRSRLEQRLEALVARAEDRLEA